MITVDVDLGGLAHQILQPRIIKVTVACWWCELTGFQSLQRPKGMMHHRNHLELERTHIFNQAGFDDR